MPRFGNILKITFFEIKLLIKVRLILCAVLTGTQN